MQNEKEKPLSKVKQELAGIIQHLNSTTACFTGHRSQKLPWRFNENDERCKAMKIRLRTEIENAIQRGYNTFLCGMALGFDMMCAEMVLELKNSYRDIKIIGALPCRNQDAMWTAEYKQRYRALIKKLDGIRCIYEKYTGVECMLERNRYMINNSSLVIALFDGSNGGTKATIEYAREQNMEIIVLQP